MASFARPELFVASVIQFALITPCFLWIWPNRTTFWRNIVISWVVPAIFATALISTLGLPLSGSRSLAAFGQHYAVNVVAHRNLHIDPWNNWKEIFYSDFGTSKNIPGALRENPKAFLWRMIENVRQLPSLPARLVGHPFRGLPFSGFCRFLFFLVIIIGLVTVLYCAGADLNKQFILRLLPVLPIAFGILVPIATSMVIIYPRLHYAIPCAILLMIMSAFGLDYLCARFALPRLSSLQSAALVICVLFLITPNRSHRVNLVGLILGTYTSKPTRFENQEVIKALRNLHIKGKVIILEPDYSRALYAQIPFKRVSQTEKHGTFWSFVEDKRINLIVLNERLRNDCRFRTDPEFIEFVA